MIFTPWYFTNLIMKNVQLYNILYCFEIPTEAIFYFTFFINAIEKLRTSSSLDYSGFFSYESDYTVVFLGNHDKSRLHLVATFLSVKKIDCKAS